jgi:uncharacterized membrane protein YoaK (UPF0700 family)
MIVFVKTRPITAFVYLHTLVNFLLLFFSFSDASIRFSSERVQIDSMRGSWERVWSTTLLTGNLVHTLASTVTRLDTEIILPFEFCQ